MKFIMFIEYSPENREKILPKVEKWVKELKQNPEKYPRFMRLQDGTAIRFNMIGKSKGFTLIEVDNEEQMQNIVSFWTPLMKFTYVPIRQSAAAKQI